VANGKESLIKDTDVINEIRKDLETHGADINFVDQRTNAKAIGFGLNYGKTAITFAKDFKIDIDEAEEMVDAYFNIYSVMKSWRDGQVEKALTEGYVNLLSVRKRRFHHAIDWFNSSFSEGLWSTKMLKEEISRQAMNAPVQGGAHDIFEPAIIRLNRRFKKEGMKSRILLYIHDGILGESPLEERPYIDAIAMEEMKTFLNKGTPLEIELKVDGDHYDWEWYGKKIKI
jgi:DNA polymerase-1